MCPDCGHAADGRDPGEFCSRCGQRLRVGKLRLGDILGELLGAILSLELPILRTARDLTLGPGRVANAWVAGRRRTYVSPVQWVVVAGVVVALLYGPLGRAADALREGGRAQYVVGLAHYSPLSFGLWCIGITLPLAWIMALLGRRQDFGRSWLEWYALALYTSGLAVGLQLIGWGVRILLPLPGLAVVEALVPLALFAWGAYGFVDRERRLAALWTAVAAVLALLVTLVTLAKLFGAE